MAKQLNPSNGAGKPVVQHIHMTFGFVVTRDESSMLIIINEPDGHQHVFPLSPHAAKEMASQLSLQVLAL